MRLRAKMAGLVLATGALLVWTDEAPAQGPGGPVQATVEAVQDLRFGVLFPGSPVRIGTGDAGQRGEIHVEGWGQYHLQFILPAALVSPEGALLRLSFGDGDGAVIRGTAGTPQLFNPAVGPTIDFDGGVTEAQIFLGGSALPSQDQRAGIYSANITILIARN